MRNKIHNRIQRFHSALGRSWKVDDQRPSPYAGQPPSQRRKRRYFTSFGAYHLAESWNFALDHGTRSLRRNVAQRHTSSSGGENHGSLSRVCQLSENVRNLIAFIAHDLVTPDPPSHPLPPLPPLPSAAI